MVSTEQRQFESWVLTGEGQEVVENGSHEARVYNAVAHEEGSLQSEIMVSLSLSLSLSQHLFFISFFSSQPLPSEMMHENFHSLEQHVLRTITFFPFSI